MKSLKMPLQYLVVLTTLSLRLLAASNEAEGAERAHLLAASVRPIDQIELDCLLEKDNVYYNFNVLRGLNIIGDTGSLEEDLKEFPYLVRFINRQDPYRIEEEVLKMDLSAEGERASNKLYGMWQDALAKKEYSLAIHALLLSEMAGDSMAGSVLEDIFKNPAREGLGHLFQPSKMLAAIYSSRKVGFIGLKTQQNFNKWYRSNRGSTSSHDSACSAASETSIISDDSAAERYSSSSSEILRKRTPSG